ncbi:hypothetical protein N7478_011077 [Penicillium angulare]|uniref:uncharacterized protein n=1 Tax=Penicillium angulare TaxID=116970 RepID=UPI00254127DC|nr:uncharacterized protein N7478_011077 [Penicillium angulare]KAJ5263472.1 hypothetical protein N7478_011077 [Penicillium angulare]
MVSLLPSDCWLKILSYLSVEDHRSLLFVSKSSNCFSEPFLMKAIAWEWKPIPLRRVLLLFRAVLRKPERACNIRHFSLLSQKSFDSAVESWHPPSCEADFKEEITHFQDVLEHAQHIVKKTAFPDSNTWTQALDSGNPYAFVSILLSQLHKLQSLSLDYTFVWQSGFPGLMLRHALSSKQLSQFNFLTHVDYGANVRRDEMSFGEALIHEEPGYPECNPKQFPAWFYLPALRSLKIWLRTKKGIELPSPYGRPDLSRLERLILTRATIEENQAPSILSLAPSLKTLHLGMAYRWGKEVALKDGPAIIEGLKYSQESLTNLSFGIEYYPPGKSDLHLQRGEYDLSAPFYGLLKQFPKLRSVEVPVNLLAGWTMEASSDLVSGLPEGVEQLCLRSDYAPVEYDSWHAEEMTELVTYNASKLKAHLPHLKRVWIRRWEYFAQDGETVPLAKAARAACAQEGIHFQVVSDELSNGIWTENRLAPDRKVL